MNITYDPSKEKRNLAKHGFSLELVAQLEWDAAIVREDDRFDYEEYRYRVFAPIASRLYVAVVVWRKGSVRAISLRKANAKEIKWYDKEID